MTKLRQLQRGRQLTLLRLTTRKKAILITLEDASLQAEIVQLEGELDANELEIKFEEEDIEEREKGSGGAGGKQQQDDDADTSIPQPSSPPPEMNQEDDSNRMYTLKNIQAIQNNRIWDFARRIFVTLDISNRKRSRQLIICYARKLVKVTYLMRHACIQEDIEENLPMDLIMKFFSADEWNAELLKMQKHLHERTLTGSLVDNIMTHHWTKDAAYPCRTEPTSVLLRMEVWEKLIDSEPLYLKWMVTPIAESVD